MGFDPTALYYSRYGVDPLSGLGFNLIYGNPWAGYFCLALFAALVGLALWLWKTTPAPAPVEEQPIKKKVKKNGRKGTI